MSSKQRAAQPAPRPAEWLTISEAMAAVRMSRKYLVGQIESGDLPSYQHGRVYRISAADFDAWLASHKVTCEGNGHHG